MKGYIYRISSKTIPNFYIGSTSQRPSKRWNNHIRDMRKGVHSCKPLQNAFNKYGESDIYFSIEREVEVPNRLALFDLEQDFISNYIKIGAPIANTDLIVKKGDCKGSPKITTYEEYENIRIFYEFDKIIYPLKEYYNIDESSLNNLVKERSYLSFNDVYQTNSLNEEEKIKRYFIFTKKLLDKVSINRRKLSLTTFQGVLILCLDELINPLKDKMYQYIKIEPTKDLMRPYREKREYTLNAHKIFDRMDYVDKINFILNNIDNDTIFYSGALTTPSFLTYIYVKYSRDNKIKTRHELAIELNKSESIISNYSSNKPRNKGIINLNKKYRQINPQVLPEIYYLIINNKFLLPRNSGKKLETPIK